MKKFVKRISKVLVLLFFSALLFIFASNVIIDYQARNFIFERLEDVSDAQVAIVLGARVYEGGTLSPMLEDRVQTGAELYKAGKVKKLLLTGDHGRKNYDEVNSMRKYALQKGVHPEDIFMNHAGFDTLDSLYRARDVFLVEKAIIVTQKFHLYRALYIARTLGIEAYGLSADKRIYQYTSETCLKLREMLAKVKAFLQLHVFHSKPKYLGSPIPITGDGRVTRDKPPLEELVPGKVFDFSLTNVVKGKEAIKAAKRLHRGEIKNVKDMAIGYYEEGLSIWFTEYPSIEIAKEETLKMAEAMERFGQGFENIEELEIEGLVVYETFPGGKEQFFWAQNKLMIYIIPGDLIKSQSKTLISKLIPIIKNEWE